MIERAVSGREQQPAEAMRVMRELRGKFRAGRKLTRKRWMNADSYIDANLFVYQLERRPEA